MRSSIIKDILCHLAKTSLPAFLQLMWMLCAADLLFGYALGGRMSLWDILFVYLAGVFLNIFLIHLLRFSFWRVMINLLAIVLIFTAVPPFSLSFSFIAAGLNTIGKAPGMILGVSIIAATAVCWYQGFRLVSSPMNFERYLGEFQFGFLIFLIIFFIQAMTGTDRNYFLPAVFYFIAGMVVLFLARREKTAAEGNSSSIINVAALICIVLTISCGLLLAVLCNPELAERIYEAGKTVLGIVLDLARRLMQLLANLFPTPHGAPPPLPPVASRAAEDPEAIAKLFRIPPVVREWMRVVVFSISAAMILAALWSVSQQIIEIFRKRKTAVPMTVQRLKTSFLKSLFDLIKNGVLVLVNKLQWLYKRFRGRNNDSLTMKFIYGQVLRWAALDGLRPKIFQTPDELYCDLTLWLPEAAPELDFITRQFVNVRYGEMRLNEEALRKAWDSYAKIRQCQKRLFFKIRRK